MGGSLVPGDAGGSTAPGSEGDGPGASGLLPLESGGGAVGLPPPDVGAGVPAPIGDGGELMRDRYKFSRASTTVGGTL